MQLHWLGKRDYLPFVVTQLLSAGSAGLGWPIIIWALATQADTASRYGFWVNIAAICFILPRLALAALGDWSDKPYRRQHRLRRVKQAEVLTMALCAVALLLGSLPWLVLALLALGVQTALAGPIRQALWSATSGSNKPGREQALASAGTYLAFLCGMAGAAVLMHGGHTVLASLMLLLLAVLSFLASRTLADTPASTADPEPKPQRGRLLLTPLRQAWNQPPEMRRALLGQAWFKSLVLIQLLLAPGLAQQWLQGGAVAIILILSLLAAGVVLGALLYMPLARGGIEIGLIPMGALGLALFGLLSWALAGTGLATAGLVLLGIAAGLYIVPLRAFMQARCPGASSTGHIAAGDILEALIMAATWLLVMLLAGLGLSTSQLFLLTALLNLAVFIYSFTCVPQYLARFIVWGLTHSLYRVRHANLQVIPEQGPAVLVCNHVSFMDPPLIMGAVKRPVRFVMAHTIFYNPVFSAIFRLVGAIPIAPRRDDERIYNRAFERIEDYLAKGEIVCIFPEGGITRDGDIKEFKSGIERIIQHTPVPVVPLAIQGMWGSYFSRHPDKGFGRRLWSRVRLVAGTPVAPAAVDRHELQRYVANLRGQWP